MRIAIDGRPLQGQLSGVGKYVLQLVLNLSKQVKGCDITIFTNKPLAIDFNAPNITIKYDHTFKKVKPLIWSKFFLARLIKKEKFDFTLFGGTFTPIQKLHEKKIVVVHDLNHIYAKETMSRLHYITHVLFFEHDISNADFIIANSNGTANKIKEKYNIIADFVLHPPIDEHYKVLESKEVKPVLTNLGINYNYILTVATQEPRKNLEKTIEAFLYLKGQKLIDDRKLLLVGGKGWKNEQLQKLIESDNDIIQLGYIPEKHLPYIYNGADVFLFPSKYEGYGMPATEAVLCGLMPVVTNIQELHEATGGHAYFIDPENKVQFEENILNSIKNTTQATVFNPLDLRKNFDGEFLNLLKLLNLKTT